MIAQEIDNNAHIRHITVAEAHLYNNGTNKPRTYADLVWDDRQYLTAYNNAAEVQTAVMDMRRRVHGLV